MSRLLIQRKRVAALLLFIFLVMGEATKVSMASEDQHEQLASELAAILRSARVMISKNQALINDPSIGDKNITPEKVVAAAKENYAKVAGKELPTPSATGLNERAEKAMLASIFQVMVDYQSLINEKGRGFKGFIPAAFTREVAKTFTMKMDGEIGIKFTAPKELIRNRNNRPDDWENKVFTQHFRNNSYAKGKPFIETNEQEYRYMAPEYYADTCLSCHGEQKGTRDISGHLKEGARIGDLAGALSVTIFLKK